MTGGNEVGGKSRFQVCRTRLVFTRSDLNEGIDINYSFGLILINDFTSCQHDIHCIGKSLIVILYVIQSQFIE